MREATLQTFGEDTVFTVKIVGVFKRETRRGRESDLTTWTSEDIGVNVAATFTTPADDTTEWNHVTRKIYTKHD